MGLNGLNIQQRPNLAFSKLCTRDICSFLLETYLDFFSGFYIFGDAMCKNITTWDQHKSAPCSSFLHMPWILCANFLLLLSVKITPRNTPATRKNVSRTGATKSTFFRKCFFSGKLRLRRKDFSSQNIFSILNKL